VAKASATSVSELDAAIEQLRNNTRRCKSDVDALHRANEETGSVADDAAGKALATAAGTLGQAEQIMQQVRVRILPTTSSASIPILCFGTPCALVKRMVWGWGTTAQRASGQEQRSVRSPPGPVMSVPIL
jgi:hypothetical protein